MIALIGALDAEIEEFLRQAEDVRVEHWGPPRTSLQSVYHCRLLGQQVVIARSGVGKVMAAAVSQRIISKYNPRQLIFTGIAGALNPQLRIGDLVLGAELMQHDLDATALGFRRGEIPYTDQQICRGDEMLLNAAAGVSLESGTVLSGRILTGDQFISHHNRQSYLTEELGGDAIEMEGAAVALVAYLNQTPALVARTISDLADGSAAVDFQKFLPLACHNSFQLISQIFPRIR